MIHCTATIDPAFVIARVDRRIYGSLLEHMGRAVYGGIYDTTAHRLREDVLALTAELGTTAVRYPGGNFVSGYVWEDAIGPVEQRPTRLDTAWRSVESNEFGLHEFMDWLARLDADPIMAVNLGTRGVLDAIRLVEYANHAGRTQLTEERTRNGAEAPWRIRTWCLGNEMDGPWQLGHLDAEAYGRLALRAGAAMRQVDPDIELIACGSSNESMPTFGAWEATVLDHAFDVVDYVSLHAYYERTDSDPATFLASGHSMDAFIRGTIATIDHIAAKRRSSKRINLAFDEWNVFSAAQFSGHDKPDWAVAPKLGEDTYSALDAVVVGDLLMTLLRHADRVTIACIAQLVNVLAPIRVEPGVAWRQTIFYPFALTSAAVRGTVLRVEPVVEAYETSKFGSVPLVDLVASLEDSGELVVLATNRSLTESAQLDLTLRGAWMIASHSGLGGDTGSLHLTNTQEHPDRVAPWSTQPDPGSIVLPPASWNLIRFQR